MYCSTGHRLVAHFLGNAPRTSRKPVMSENHSITPSHLPPAGWYRDPQNPAAQRYWDGAQWLDPDVPPASAAASDAAPRKRRPTWWQWVLIALGALLLIGIVGSAMGGSRATDDIASDGQRVVTAEPTTDPVVDEPDTSVAVPGVVGKTIGEARALLEAAGFTLTADDSSGEDWVIVSQGPESGQKAEPGAAVSVVAEAPKPVYTLEQENALEAARSYLDVLPFSRQGLIDQLSSQYGSGFPVDVATWAVDTVGADWNAEAVEAAQSYLDTMSFSRQGLFDQLTSAYGSQFTPEQADHALAAVGY
jgi:hypothetical protein